MNQSSESGDLTGTNNYYSYNYFTVNTLMQSTGGNKQGCSLSTGSADTIHLPDEDFLVDLCNTLGSLLNSVLVAPEYNIQY